MAYSPPPFTEFVWQDAPSTATSLRASNLIADEQNLASYVQSVIIDYDTYARATFATQGSLPGQLANSAYWLSGNAASRPSAGAVSTGSFYRASDTGVVSVSDGSSWHLVATETLGVPIGSIEQYGGSADPVDNDGTSRWLICDGRAISRSTYSNTFTAIGTTYGSGNGTTTFNIPDMRQRFPLGKAASGTGSTLGTTGGAIDHTHSVPGLSIPTLSTPNHTHSVPGLSVPGLTTPSHFHNLTSLGGASAATFGGIVYVDESGPGFNYTSAFQTTTEVGGSGTTNASLGLVGRTASGGGSGITGTGTTGSGTSGSAGSGVTGTGTTGTGTSGTANPPYLVVNFIIRVL